ncbi:hypothetical protein Tco_0644485 [Tanacetum coccineum]
MILPELERSTQGYPLDSVEVFRFYTLAGNPVKEILLKLNLPDHRILKDGGEAIQADYDIKATNIILQGLPPEVYALVSNHKVAKEL